MLLIQILTTETIGELADSLSKDPSPHDPNQLISDLESTQMKNRNR